MVPVRLFLIAAGFTAIAAAQGVIDPARLPKELRDFERPPGEVGLKCEVMPIKPRLDFGFRFQSGYAMRIPLGQYSGPGHRWGILTRVTPEGGKPVYLLNIMRLPNVPKTKVEAEVGGSYLIGEGRYTVDLLLTDDTNRSCRKQWKVEAKRTHDEKKMTVRIPPGTVRQVGSRHAAVKTESGAKAARITVLVHAAPISPRSTRLRFYDREMLIGTLGPLLEQLPAASVRLVVFNLDQQKKLLNKADFHAEDLDQVGQALNGLELGTVNYTVLQNQGGHVDLLAGLINDELNAKERPDAVVFLGPVSRYLHKFPDYARPERSDGDPQFYYLQYRPFMRRGEEFADVIQNAVKAMKGKTFVVHSPGEFANALRQVETRLIGRAPETPAAPRTSF